MSKGSNRRPMSISQKIYQDRWERVFNNSKGRKKKQKQNPQLPTPPNKN